MAMRIIWWKTRKTDLAFCRKYDNIYMNITRVTAMFNNIRFNEDEDDGNVLRNVIEHIHSKRALYR